MSGLLHTLSVGSESLFLSRQGVDTAGHNISNAHTEGYSRQRVDAVTRDPSEGRGLIIGNGAYAKGISRATDRFVESEINHVKQNLGNTKTSLEELKRLEYIYSPESNISVADEITKFFNSLEDLSQFPDEVIVRTNVIESAQNMIIGLKRVDTGLRTAQRDINDRVMGEITEVNSLLEEISKLNISISGMEVGGVSEANDLRDNQELLLRKLNEKMQINYYRSDKGMLTVRGPGETLLVDRGYSANLGAVPNGKDGGLVDVGIFETSTSTPKLFSQLNSKGKFKAFFDVRDRVIDGLLEKNNMMTMTIAENINNIHRQGFGLNEFGKSTGRDFFQISKNIDFATRSMEISDLIVDNPDAISVAATPNAPGDNIIVNEMLRLNNECLMNDGRSRLTDYYASYVGVLGLEMQRTDHLTKANEVLLTDLNARREAIAGVSLDEEAANLIKWQANFTASSKLITTIDEMLETVLNLKR